MSANVLQRMTYLIFLGLAVAGCASSGSSTTATTTTTTTKSTDPVANLLAMLTAQPAHWQGTPYQLGGTNRNGIDCSGFVHLTFKNKLGRTLPRSTAQLSTVGKKIDPSTAQTGDLVFFHTRPGVDHVGIYLTDGKFVHASTSRGVIVSKLSNVYWQPRFWQMRRVAL